ncbi:universal stress protein [Blastococcus sp. SYSU D01042]
MQARVGNRPVVVGVDGSRPSHAAVPVAAREAQLRGAPLRLVVALPAGAGEDLPAPEGLDGTTVLRVAADLVLEGLEAEVARHFPGLPVSSALLDGPASDVLVRESAHAQLITVGSASAGALEDVLLGSTAAALARRARCPLLVVPVRPTTAIPDASGVVVGLPGDGGDDELLAFAVRAAADRGSAVTAVHTWRHTAPGVLHLALEPLGSAVAAERREEAVLYDVIDRAGDLPVPVHPVVRRAGAAETLLAAALTAELLVVGHRHDGGGHLRSVTSAVLHRSTCPVAVLPLGAPTGDRAGAGRTRRGASGSGVTAGPPPAG